MATSFQPDGLIAGPVEQPRLRTRELESRMKRNKAVSANDLDRGTIAFSTPGSSEIFPNRDIDKRLANVFVGLSYLRPLPKWKLTQSHCRGMTNH